MSGPKANYQRGPYKPIGVARTRKPIKQKRKGVETGKWLARYVGLDGKEHQCGIHATKTAAKDAADDAVDALNGKSSLRANRSVQHQRTRSLAWWVECRDRWPNSEALDERTLRTNVKRVRRVVRFLGDCEDASPEELIRQDLLMALGQMLKAGLGKATIDGSFAALSSFYKSLGEIVPGIENPARGIRVDPKDLRLKNKAHESPAHHVVDREHLWAVYDLASPLVRPWLITVAVSGCRPAEFFAVNRRWWDADTQRMYIHETATRYGALKPGLKGTHHIENIWLRGRWVPWPRELMAMYDNALPRQIHGYLVLSPTGRIWCDGNYRKRVWNVFMDEAEERGIPRFTMYDLRHSFATWLADAGIPYHVIESWTGHTPDEPMFGRRRSTLRRVYIHETDAWLPQGLAVVRALLSRVKPPRYSVPTSL